MTTTIICQTTTAPEFTAGELATASALVERLRPVGVVGLETWEDQPGDGTMAGLTLLDQEGRARVSGFKLPDGAALMFSGCLFDPTAVDQEPTWRGRWDGLEEALGSITP